MKTYIVAEIGINHNGSIALAKEMIDIAVSAGCDAVKFQTRDPNICVPENQKNLVRSTPWGTITYLRYKKHLELQISDYYEIDRYCKIKGIDWSTSVWDENAFEIMSGNFELPWIKIPSALMLNFGMIEKCIKRYPRTIISTGMSTNIELMQLLMFLKMFKEEHGCLDKNVTLMHSVAEYPTKVENVNLSMIKTLQHLCHANGIYIVDEFGYSGHECGLVTTMAAILVGATIIERHITLDKNSFGTDQSSSIEPSGVFKLVKGIRDIELAYGDGIKRMLDPESQKREELSKC